VTKTELYDVFDSVAWVMEQVFELWLTASSRSLSARILLRGNGSEDLERSQRLFTSLRL